MDRATKEITLTVFFFLLLVGALLGLAQLLEESRERDRVRLVECVEDHDYATCNCWIYDDCSEDTQ